MPAERQPGQAPWVHDDLVRDLAGHLFAPNRMVWQDIQLGPSGSPRPDVFCVMKSFAHPQATAYECKISVTDFRSDVTSGKWQKYLAYAGAVIFAAPAGLIQASDVPTHCGLMVRGDKGWRLAKKPVRSVSTLPPEAALKLLIDGVERQGPMYRARSYGHHDNEFNKRYGAEAARWVHDAASVMWTVEHTNQTNAARVEAANKRAQQVVADAMREAPGLWQRITNAVGLPPESDVWAVRGAVHALEVNAAGGPDSIRYRELMQALGNLTRRYAPQEVEEIEV